MAPIVSNRFYFGKKVCVLGLGRSGMAAARLLMKCGAVVTVYDSSNSPHLLERAETLRREGIHVMIGPDAEKDSACYELAIISPGIEEESALVLNIKAKGIPLIGELELAYTLCGCPIVAITGSNGKTTTTELTTLILESAGLNVSSCGNIGTPMSELLLKGDVWDALVVETSSFQLETIRTFRPKVAVWLNLSPNHLDRYPSLKEYRDAKLRIFENQHHDDVAVLPHGQEFSSVKASRISFSTKESSADLTLRGTEILYKGMMILDLKETNMKGAHNAANVMAAFAGAMGITQTIPTLTGVLRNYKTPAHRCELIAEHRGVRWINDSKATNLDAMEQAIRSVQGRLILIAGGKDKGFGFAPIAPLIQERVTFAILIGEIRDRISEEWASVPSATVDSMEEAVLLASRMADPDSGSSVLLSPGTSSFDMFRDYIERGEAFRALVNRLSSTPELSEY